MQTSSQLNFLHGLPGSGVKTVSWSKNCPNCMSMWLVRSDRRLFFSWLATWWSFLLNVLTFGSFILSVLPFLVCVALLLNWPFPDWKDNINTCFWWSIQYHQDILLEIFSYILWVLPPICSAPGCCKSHQYFCTWVKYLWIVLYYQE